MKTELTVQAIGEQGLLTQLQAFCPAEVIGDDAAVLALPAEQSLVVTTDLLVENVHFSDQTTSAEDVGWRAAAANLSDLAAMGASPVGITVGLGLPGHLSVDWVLSLYQGLQACLAPWQTPILGGDICRSAQITVAITALGQVSPQQAIKRSAARPGDLIIASGVHGASRAGLELLLNTQPIESSCLTKTQYQRFIQAHQRPCPRLDWLPILRALPADIPLAGMDSSDGLADAVLQICRASGVGAQLEQAQLPLPPGLVDWVGLETALDWALYGGEDFELILCLPPACLPRLQEQTNCSVIGRITVGSQVLLNRPDQPPLELSLTQGFQHFQSLENLNNS
ncbi:thiamine-phosphate kinase [Synechocystis sp. LKSZ1]|uniref:thiamine-phosphate kinase n=1 Tax=Synechocystis sp. LKSZ1 TaxID=3144951 RepID=UPI00336C02AE